MTYQVPKMSWRGFTLIELMVVIAIVGLLASTIIASMENSRSRARDAQRISEARQLLAALELYRNRNGRYPCSGSAVGCAAGTAGGAAVAVIKGDRAHTYTAFETSLRTALNFTPGLEQGTADTILYRVRSSTGNNNNATDPNSYSIIIDLENSPDCKINVGAGHDAYAATSTCTIQGV